MNRRRDFRMNARSGDDSAVVAGDYFVRVFLRIERPECGKENFTALRADWLRGLLRLIVVGGRADWNDVRFRHRIPLAESDERSRLSAAR